MVYLFYKHHKPPPGEDTRFIVAISSFLCLEDNGRLIDFDGMPYSLRHMATETQGNGIEMYPFYLRTVIVVEDLIYGTT